MSPPHTITSSTTHGLHIDEAITREFAVTENGFLPSGAPLKRLPDPYYAPWERLAHRLPALIQERRIRCEVDLLPVLSVDRLRTEPEWRKAYSVLTFLAHGYIWGGDAAAEILPPALTVPLLQVSLHLELPPVATYAGLNLWNFSCAGTSFADVESLQATHTFTGTEDESWFLMVSVAMECQGAQIISTMLSALDALKIRADDYLATVAAALETLPPRFQTIGDMLDRMHERCDPMVFYHDIRPFLAGSKNMAAAGLPRGVFFDEGDGRGEWMHLRGGSNGQSSLIQFFDAVLGVDHAPAGNKTPGSQGLNREDKSYHEEVRDYMPGPHKRFLEHVQQMGSIRNIASQLSGPDEPPEQARLREAYKSAIAALTEFRNRHLNLVARFIVVPARQARNGPGRPGTVTVNLASASSALAARGQKAAVQAELTGTGGTALLPFLKHVRDETSRAASEIR